MVPHARPLKASASDLDIPRLAPSEGEGPLEPPVDATPCLRKNRWSALGAVVLLLPPVAYQTLTLLGSGGSRLASPSESSTSEEQRCFGHEVWLRRATPRLELPPARSVPHRNFPRYAGVGGWAPSVPTWIITPPNQSSIHRFFDSSPFSPSGRYVALTRVSPAAEGRTVQPGDQASVIVVDLRRGTERVVAQTRGWSSQLGAQVQWGATDSDLFFNDIEVPSQRLQAARKRRPATSQSARAPSGKETSAAEGSTDWRPYGVRLDMHSGRRTRLGCTVYHVSSDGRWALTPDLRRMSRTQLGYGVHVPEGQVPRNSGAPRDDGLWVSDTRTGECRMLVSLAEVAAHARDASLGGARALDPALPTYAFHAKWNAQMNRVLFVARQAACVGFLAWAKRTFTRQDSCSVPSYKTNHVIVLDIAYPPSRSSSAGAKAEDTGGGGSAGWPTVRAIRHVVSWGKNARVVGGSHPNWMADGNEVSMNLQCNENGVPSSLGPWAFVGLRAEGATVQSHTHAHTSDPPSSPNVRRLGWCGSGHPLASADGSFLVTDAYPKEAREPSSARANLRWRALPRLTSRRARSPLQSSVFHGLSAPGTVPLRLLDVRSDSEAR